MMSATSLNEFHICTDIFAVFRKQYETQMRRIDDSIPHTTIRKIQTDLYQQGEVMQPCIFLYVDSIESEIHLPHSVALARSLSPSLSL